MEVEFTEAEQEALDKISELQALVDNLPEQHLYEQRQLSDAVSRIADGVFARAAYRVRYAERVQAYRADPEGQAGYMEKLRREALNIP